MDLRNLTVIVPVGPGDSSWRSLTNDLLCLSPETEVIFVGAQTEALEGPSVSLPKNWRWLVSSKKGRAIQMNQGASIASKDFLWFLHADSRFHKNTLNSLLTVSEPDALHYFDLSFNEGSKLLWVNSVGTWIRSHLIGIPFGDQGFFMSRSVFLKLGGFNESLDCGEDHHFLWKAKKANTPVRWIGGRIYTSGRKYSENGWRRTTLNHLRLTTEQAIRFSS